MRQFSACIEWLFAREGDDFADRIRLAHQAGLSAVEFWRWTNKDLDAIASVIEETGIAVSGIVAEPMIALTNPANKDAWLEGLEASASVAERLGAAVLIAQAGDDLPEFSRAEQREALISALSAGADILSGSGIRLGLEPLNTKIDHVGYFLSSTAEGLDIVDEVGRPEIGIVYDIYHSAVMGERTEDVVGERADRIVHVHVADHPGRNDPGTGGIDLLERLNWLFAHGYSGRVGLEYRPKTKDTEAVRAVVTSLSA
ncbi:TIM barrel protein [Rhizobium leucaenae]|uniref:Hydroxypyruvate isomerase n=1 Tax=Rhizobium leucaenae TaxID=29450 RepID=A0A7W7EPI5_9HYPH|nr:TIM barrel protein [Rhizobium leucaenae]MBB4571278.1 hydroxypyruvate isomerase [Rhizobium leucaenae]MBB6304901.1 hydroxypyruvate isomerase [Rhizobium leucaenae]